MQVCDALSGHHFIGFIWGFVEMFSKIRISFRKSNAHSHILDWCAFALDGVKKHYGRTNQRSTDGQGVSRSRMRNGFTQLQVKGGGQGLILRAHPISLYRAHVHCVWCTPILQSSLFNCSYHKLCTIHKVNCLGVFHTSFCLC